MPKRKANNPLKMYEPTRKQEMDYAIERAVEKALLTHPQTLKLRKVIEAEMKKATKVTPKKG